jgi:hypothetical protein
MLKDKLLFFMHHHHATHFLQDGASCHTNEKVMAFLRQQSFAVMDWPGTSPDLNLIENLWGIVKSELKKKGNISSLPPPHQGNQRAGGDPAQAPHAEAGPLHADQDQAVFGEQWSDDKY